MEYQKITNLLGNILDKVPRFITKKWIEVHDHEVHVKGIVTVSVDERDRDRMNRQVILKNKAPFISCISKIVY